jgi:hypothetical protein
MSCGIREYELYFRFANTVVPDVLRNLYAIHKQFYVKGGKAADEYLKQKIGSPDWDIVAYIRNPSEINGIDAQIFTTLQAFQRLRMNTDATLVKEPIKYNEPGKPEQDMIQYGISQGGCKRMFLDVVFVVGEFPGASVRHGIPYQKKAALLAELEVIWADRNKQIQNAAAVSNPLAFQNFETVMMTHVQNAETNLQEHLTQFTALIARYPEDEQEELSELLNDIRMYEQEKGALRSYTEYLNFLELKQNEENRITKRNLTRKRRNRLANSPNNTNENV